MLFVLFNCSFKPTFFFSKSKISFLIPTISELSCCVFVAIEEFDLIVLSTTFSIGALFFTLSTKNALLFSMALPNATLSPSGKALTSFCAFIASVNLFSLIAIDLSISFPRAINSLASVFIRSTSFFFS